MDNMAPTGYREIHPHLLRCRPTSNLTPFAGPGLPQGVVRVGWDVTEDVVVLE